MKKQPALKQSTLFSFSDIMQTIEEGEIYESVGDVMDTMVTISKNEFGINVDFDSEITGFLPNELKFKKRLQAYTFPHIVDMNKTKKIKCRVEHWLINEHKKCYSEDDAIVSSWNKFADGRYMSLGLVLVVLSYMHTDVISEIIQDGEWFIEED